MEEGEDWRLVSNLTTSETVRSLQQTLARKSKSEPTFRFYALYDKVYRKDVLEEAWKRVRANKGSSGVDGITLEAIEESGVEGYLTTLQEELKSYRYQPQALKRVWIPKTGGGKRALAIPTVKDRVAQQAARMIIEPIFEPHFSDQSYGFRPNRGAHQAVEEVIKLMNWGLVEVMETDIQDCFGSIPHGELLETLAKRIVDGKMLRLIKLWLKARIMEEGETKSSNTGTPQGGVISPLLANVYLDKLDQMWKEKGMDKKHNAHLVRYADDLVILTNQGTRVPREYLKWILGKLNLKAHPKKTRELKAQESHFDFLGYNFRKRENPKTGKWFTLAQPSIKAQRSLRGKLKRMTSSSPRPIGEVVHEINPVVRGWVNYFRLGNSSRVFGKIRGYTMKRVRRSLRRQQGRHGYGWQTIPNDFFYGSLGLFCDYHVSWSGRTI